MALPQEVINRMSEERPSVPGWSGGLLGFSFGLLVIVFAMYAVIVFVQTPRANNTNSQLTSQIAQASQSINSTQTNAVVDFYSQASHVQEVVNNHIFFSQFLTWLQNNTEANVYYSSLISDSSGKVSLIAFAQNLSDLNQQIAVFESSPQVLQTEVSGISPANLSNYLQTEITLTLSPSVFLSPTAASSSLMENTSTTQ